MSRVICQIDWNTRFLSCISVHYQLRMTSNEIASTPSRLHSAGRAMVLFKINMWGGEGGVLGDVVGAAAWGCRIYMLRGGWMVAGKGVRFMQWWGCVFVLGHWQSLVNRSMRIQDLYVGVVPIPQFIKKKSRG